MQIRVGQRVKKRVLAVLTELSNHFGVSATLRQRWTGCFFSAVCKSARLVSLSLLGFTSGCVYRCESEGDGGNGSVVVVAVLHFWQ
ncbi:unnamed protein product [Schistocephalus solidus]|uniref:Uncharacterized protein n=1 Tax=Schistocephalus solidus TaxID=70667 RepID=A0A183T943_SCHSO|nr:unnamed protein product [Schistocephalus solidus]